MSFFFKQNFIKIKLLFFQTSSVFDIVRNIEECELKMPAHKSKWGIVLRTNPNEKSESNLKPTFILSKAFLKPWSASEAKV